MKVSLKRKITFREMEVRDLFSKSNFLIPFAPSTPILDS